MSDCDLRFHRNIGFPKRLLLPEDEYPVYKTEHSKNRSENNKHGQFEVPDTVHVTKQNIVEVKVKDKSLWRILVRKEYNEQYDVCYVIQFPDYELITAWRNEKDDTHETLNKDDYNHPNEFSHYIQQ